MVQFTDQMKKMLEEQLCMIATVSKDGLPNIGPKRSGRIYGENSIIWNENTSKQILQDIKDGSKVAIAVVDWPKLKGFRFVGTPKVYYEGDGAPYEDCEEAAKGKLKMGKPKAAVVVEIEKIYTLDSGPKAGDLLAE